MYRKSPQVACLTLESLEARLTPAAAVIDTASLIGDHPNSMIPFAVDTDAAGNIYVAGSFGQTFDADPGPGVALVEASGSGLDAFVAKYSPDHDLLWAQRLDVDEKVWVHGMVADAAGKVYVAGGSSPQAVAGPTLTYESGFVQKLDTAGNLVWSRQISGTRDAGASDLVTDALGNVYVIGSFAGTADFDPGPDVFELTSTSGDDGFLLKLDAAGHFVWAQTVDYQPTALAVDSHYNVLVVSSKSFTGADTAVIAKISATGSLIWQQQFAGYYFPVNAVAVDPADNVLLVGSVERYADLDPGPNARLYFGDLTSFVIKLDSAGQLVWAWTLNGPVSDAVAVDVHHLGRIYVGGSIRQFAEELSGYVGYYSVPLVFRLDSSGHLDWLYAGDLNGHVTRMGLPVTALAVDPTGHVHIVGTSGTVIDTFSSIVYLATFSQRDDVPAEAPLVAPLLTTATGPLDALFIQMLIRLQSDAVVPLYLTPSIQPDSLNLSGAFSTLSPEFLELLLTSPGAEAVVQSGTEFITLTDMDSLLATPAELSLFASLTTFPPSSDLVGFPALETAQGNIQTLLEMRVYLSQQILLQPNSSYWKQQLEDNRLSLRCWIALTHAYTATNDTSRSQALALLQNLLPAGQYDLREMPAAQLSLAAPELQE